MRARALRLLGLWAVVVAVGCSNGSGGTGRQAGHDTGPRGDAGVDAAVDAAADVADTAPDAGVDRADIDAQLRRPVTVITDKFGMRHIFATSLEDLFFMNGYMYATDRFIQMEFYRRVATGTLSELFGTLSNSAVKTDVLMRTLGLKRSAKKYIAEHYDPNDETYQAIDAYCAGVNAFIAKYRHGEVSLPGTMAHIMPPSSVRDWEPSDVLAVGRLLAVQLTYTAPTWIKAHAVRQSILDTFKADAADPKLAARHGFLADVMRTAPASTTTQIDGFPTDGKKAIHLPAASFPPAPTVSKDVLQHAMALHQPLDIPGMAPLDIFGVRDAFKRGSNDWVLSGDRTASGYPNVANDPHLGLSLPTIFYPIQLDLDHDIDGRKPLHLVGAGILGVPGIVVGRTDKVAWGTTVGFYDYVDVYDEHITGHSDDAQAPTVAFKGNQVPVDRIHETINIGTFGHVTDHTDLTLEVVPHHGPILPTVVDGKPVARTSNEALSIKWVGLKADNDFKFLMGLWRAKTPADVEQALDYYTVGSSNFVFGFTSGDIFYSGQSHIPVREPGALTYDPVDNPTGNAPIFILPGDGSAEWDGFLPDEDIPHAYNPQKGYIVTANNDQVGTTLDNNPFNDAHYLGGFYDLGLRAERITERLTNATGERPAGQKLTLAEQTAIQNDGYDKVAEHVVPHMVAAIDRALDTTIDASQDPELKALRDEISGREADLSTLRDLLDGWDYQSPATRQPTGDDVQRSAAASLFNAAMVYLLRDVYGDELGQLGYYHNHHFSIPSPDQILTRSLIYLLDDAQHAQTYDAATGDSTVFDDLSSDLTETRLTMLVRAVLAARDRLASGAALASVWGQDIPSPGSGDPSTWVWGKMHGLRLDSLVPASTSNFRRPSPDRGLPFYERSGGEFAVSPCDHGYDDFNFTCTGGSSLRMIHDMTPDGPVTYNVVPGGYSSDPSSPSYDSEVERWNRAQPRKLEDDRIQVGGRRRRRERLRAELTTDLMEISWRGDARIQARRSSPRRACSPGGYRRPCAA